MQLSCVKVSTSDDLALKDFHEITFLACSSLQISFGCQEQRMPRSDSPRMSGSYVLSGAPHDRDLNRWRVGYCADDLGASCGRRASPMT